MKFPYATYFDASATTPPDMEVVQAMDKMNPWGNPYSQHHVGRDSFSEIEQSLKKIAKILNISHHQLVPTYSGTDSNRKIMNEIIRQYGTSKVFVSRAEHSSIFDEVDEKQLYSPNTPKTIPQDAKAIAIMRTNSETGRQYDIQKFRENFPHALILCDMCQSIAKGEMPDLSICDFATFSAQKFYGPQQVGLLYVKTPEKFPDLLGDRHTKSARLTIGMKKAFEIWEKNREKMSEQFTRHQQMIENFILNNIPESRIHEIQHPRSPGITNAAFRGIRGSELATILDKEEGICLSTGSTCSSNLLTPSRIILDIETNPDYQYPIRISLHKHLTDENVENFCEILAHYVSEHARQ